MITENKNANNNVSEFEFNEAVKKAAAILKSSLMDRMEVCRIAVSVCEITRGGTNFEGKFTIKRFATECGISPKTLSNWIGIYRNVFVNLNENQRASAKMVELIEMDEISRKRKIPKKNMEKEFYKFLHIGSYQKRIDRYLKMLGTICSKFKSNEEIDKINKKQLQQFLFYSTTIQKRILAYNKEIEATDFYEISSSSYSRANKKLAPNSNITKEMERKILVLRKKNHTFLEIANFFRKRGIKTSKPAIIKYYNKYLSGK